MNIAEFATKRKDLLVGLGFFLITIILAKKVIYAPQEEKINLLKEKIREERKKVSLLKEIEQIEQDISFYQKKISPRKEVSWVLDEVTKIAKDAEIKIATLEPQPPEDIGIYTRLPLKLKVECSYHELGNFLSRLENSEKFLRVDSMQIESREGIEFPMPDKSKAMLVVSSVYLKK